MIRLLTQADAASYQNLRLLSLKNDPNDWVSTLDSESSQTPGYFANKIFYATKQPVFGFYGMFDDTVRANDHSPLLAYAQLGYEYYPKKQHLVNLYELSVHPNHRHQGLATTLLTHLIDIIKAEPSLEQMVLHVNAANTPAISLYQKLGFTQIATLPNTIKESPTSYQDEYCFTRQV